MDLLKVDWHAVFMPQHSLLALFLRGTIMYLVIFALLRVVVRRQVGGIGMTVCASFMQAGWCMVMYESVANLPAPPAASSL